ncbi:MAG: hypothetical protein KDK65_04205 [Chlamydiia bacterium]|nr:hypothetical protein [Chlamydiia bacterium]
MFRYLALFLCVATLAWGDIVYAPCPPQLRHDVWHQVQPYLLPDTHPAKEKLDQLFSSYKVTRSHANLRKSGFILTDRKFHKVIVAKHPQLKGYVVKIYTDEQPEKMEWARWITRIVGADAIRKKILEKGYQHDFVVPRKWIYPLPSDPHHYPNRKHFVLIAEDMRLLDRMSNYSHWKHATSPQLLHKLYVLFRDLGLSDSCLAFNVPFNVNGQIAIIDTEIHHTWPVPYERLLQYLNPHNQVFWRQLTKCKKSAI